MSYLSDPVTDDDYASVIADVSAMNVPATMRGDLIMLRLAHDDVLKARANGDPYAMRVAMRQRTTAHTRLLVALRSN